MHSPRAFTIAYLVGACAIMLGVLAYPGAALTVAAWMALLVLWQVSGRSIVSPPLIVAAGLAVVATAGHWLYPVVVDAPHSAGIWLPADPDLLSTGYSALITASLATSVGGLAVAAFTRRSARTRLKPAHMGRTLRLFLVFATIVPTLGTITVRGVDGLLERGRYLPDESAGGLAGVLTLGGIISMVICGYLLRTQRGPTRVLVLLNIVLYTLLAVSTGTRRLAATPALLAVGYFVARPGKRATRLIFLCVVAAFLLVPLPLYWRTLDAHGLIPYLASLSEYAGADLGIGAALKTVLISLPIIGATVGAKPPPGSLWISLDPRGGRAAGWYEIAQSMRLNAHTPTAGVGELAYHGTAVLVVFFLVVGLYLGFLDRHVRALLSRGHQLVAFAHLGMTALFLLNVMQYNLRSSTRMLYYSLALLAAYTVWLWATHRVRHQHRRWPTTQQAPRSPVTVD